MLLLSEPTISLMRRVMHASSISTTRRRNTWMSVVPVSYTHLNAYFAHEKGSRTYYNNAKFTEGKDEYLPISDFSAAVIAAIVMSWYMNKLKKQHRERCV